MLLANCSSENADTINAKQCVQPEKTAFFLGDNRDSCNILNASLPATMLKISDEEIYIISNGLLYDKDSSLLTSTEVVLTECSLTTGEDGAITVTMQDCKERSTWGQCLD